MNVNLAFLGSQPGFFEMFLIFGAVLLLFGADSLPKFARQFGRLMEELRRASQDFRDQVTRADVEMKDMTRDVWQDDHEDYNQEYDYHADHDDYHHDDYHHDEYHDADGNPIDPDHHDMDSDASSSEDHDLHYKDDHGEAALGQAAKTVARESVTEQLLDEMAETGGDKQPDIAAPVADTNSPDAGDKGTDVDKKDSPDS